MARQSKRVKKKLATKAARRSTGGRRASFRTESLEPRIMLSATWTDADTGDDIAGPTDGDDIFVGSDGTDIVDGLAGDDVMAGGAGGDTFLFDSAADGDVKTVDGGTGDDVIDLSARSLSDLTFSDGQITVNTGTGSFVIDHTDIETIRTADGDLSVLDGDLSEVDFSGSGSWLAGDEVFSVDVTGGTADLAWDATTSSLSVTDASGNLTITHVGGDDFTVGDITFPGDAMALTVDGDVSGTIDVGGSVTGAVTVSGDLEGLEVGGTLTGDLSIAGDATSITVDGEIVGDLTITGDLGGFEAGASVDGDLSVGGEAESLTVGGSMKGSIDVSGPLGTLDVGDKLEGALDVGGDAGPITIADDATQSITVDGDAESLSVGGKAKGDVTIGGDLGSMNVADKLEGDVTLSGDAGTVSVGKSVKGSFTVSGDLDTLDVGDKLEGVLDVGGDAESITVAKDANESIEVDGDVTSLSVGGKAKGDVTIGGDLGSMNVADELEGDVTLSGDAGTVSVGKSIKGSFTVSGNLATLDVGDKLEGVLDVGGDAESITVAKDANESIEVDGDVTSLSVGGKAKGDVTIGGDLGSMNVADELKGDVTLSGDAGTVSVGKSIKGTFTVSGNLATLDVDGKLEGVTLIGGNADSIDIAGDAKATLTVDGHLDALTFGAKVEADVVVGRKLESVEVVGDLTATITSRRILGDFDASANGVVYDESFETAVQVVLSNAGLAVSASPVPNSDPVVAEPLVDVGVNEGDALSIVVPDGTFTDVDRDAMTFSATLDGGAALPAWLTFDVETGTFSGTPDQSAVGGLDVSVTVDDGQGGSATDTFRITVANVDFAPEVDNAVVNQSATEHDAFSYVVPEDAFLDPDGDAMALEATQSDGSPLPDWLDFDPNTRTFSGTPGDFDVETVTVSLRATDPTGLWVEDSFTISVAGVADAPVDIQISSNGVPRVAEPGTVVGTLSTTDVDAGDTADYAIVGGSDWFEIDGDRLVVRPDVDLADAPGDVDVTIRTTDGDGLSYEETISVSIDNSAPTVDAGIADQTATEESPFTFAVPADAFADVDADALTLTATLEGGDPLPDWISFDSGTGTFSGTPDDPDLGSISVVVTATDGDGASVAESFDIEVEGVNDAPVTTSSIPTTAVQAGDPLTVTLPVDLFTDVDGDELALTARLSDGSPLPDWLTFDPDAGTLSGTPGSEDLGVTSVTVTATDGDGETTTETFFLAVTETATTGDPIILSADATFDDLDGSQLFISGDRAFVVTVIGSGTVDVAWDEGTGTVGIVDVDDSDFRTSIEIDDLGPGDLVVGEVTVDVPVGRVEVPAGTDAVTIAAGGWIGSIVIDDGGVLDALTFDEPLSEATVVTGSVLDLNLVDVDAGGTLTVNGDVDALDVSGDVNGTISVSGAAASVTVSGAISGTVDVDGEAGTISAGSITATGRVVAADAEDLRVTVSGAVAGELVFEGDVTDVTVDSVAAGGSITIGDDLDGTLTVAGDVDGAIVTGDDLTELVVGGDIGAAVSVGGSAGSIEITGTLSADLDVAGDLGSIQAGDVAAVVTADTVTGTVRIEDGAEVIERTYVHSTAIRYDGITGELTATTTGTGSGDTIVGQVDDETLVGGGGNDVLSGDGGDDVLDGGDGTDTVTYADHDGGVTVDLAAGTATGAESGDDTLISIENATGSGGDDVLAGDDGDNRLDGGAGDDVLAGDDGDDWLIGGAGDDSIDGGDGVDRVSYEDAAGGVTVDLASGTATGDGTDVLGNIEDVSGSAFDDVITGDSGANRLVAGAGDDIVDGGAGDDVVYGQGGDDVLSGGDGTDTLAYNSSSSMDVDLAAGTATGEGTDSVDGFENVLTGSGADTIRGDAGDNVLDGGSGDDTLAGRGGDDTLRGGSGWDTADYSEAGGSVDVDLGAGTASGAAGNDTLESIEHATGSGSDDTLTGSSGANRLDGGAGDDVIDGGAGDDRLIGGDGDDILIGGDGTDTVDYSGTAGSVDVDLAAGTATGSAGTDTISGVENVVGTDGDDRITGDAGDNRIEAGAGDDTVDGGAGDDVFVAGTGSDAFDGGAGSDTVTYAAESDDVTVDLSAGSAERGGETSTLSSVENVTGGSGDDSLTGDAAANRLDGGSGDDTLVGGEGDDVLVGGDGDDLAVYSGNWSDYRITDNGDGTYTIADTVAGRDGTDVVEGIESFEFADGTLDVEDLVNRVPADLSLGSSNVNESAAIGSVVGTVSVTDVDVLDDHQFEMVDDADGRFSIDADTGEITVAGDLDHETNDYHDITVTVTDEAGETRTETVRIDIDDVNEAATDLSLTSNTIAADAAGGTVVGTVQVADADDGDTHTLAISTGGDRFELVGDEIRLKAGASLDPDEGAIAVTVTATDAAGATFTETLYVDVLGVNAAPVEVETPADQSTIEDEAFSFALPAGTFTDPDGDSLSLSAMGAGGGALPDWLTFDPATGTFSGTPGNDDPGAYPVTVTATDPDGLSVTSSFTVTVVNANDQPIVGIAADDLMIIEDAPFTATLGAQTFVDADGDTLAVSATLAGGDPLPDWLEFDADSWTFSGTPDNDAVGRMTITMTAEDPSGASVQESFVIEVANTNDDPIANRPIPSVTVVEDQAWSYMLPANAIIDVDAGDTLTFTATLADGSPLPDWVDFNADSLSLSGLAPIGTLETLDIVITGTDDSGASATRTFRIESVSAPEIDAARYADADVVEAELVDPASSDVSGIGERAAEARVEPESSETVPEADPADEADPWAGVGDELSIIADDVSGSGPVVLGLDDVEPGGEADRLDSPDPDGVRFDGLSGDDPVDVEFAVVEDVDFVEGPEARSFSVEAAGDFEDTFSEVREEVDSMQQVVDGALLDETGDAADADAREAADAANTGSMAAIWSLARGLLGARSTETREERGGGSGRSRR